MGKLSAWCISMMLHAKIFSSFLFHVCKQQMTITIHHNMFCIALINKYIIMYYNSASYLFNVCSFFYYELFLHAINRKQNKYTCELTCTYILPAISEQCLHNYTIGMNSTGCDLPVIINQSDPVCLICSYISNSLWMIDHVNTPPIPTAPYILYVPFPATTFLGGPTVACYSAGMADLVSSTGK